DARSSLLGLLFWRCESVLSKSSPSFYGTTSLLVRFATRRARGDQSKLSCAGVGTGERCMIASSLEVASSGMLSHHLHRPACSAPHSRWQAPGRARGPLLAGAPEPGAPEHRGARSRRFEPVDGLVLSAARPRHPGALLSPPSTHK